MIQIGLNHVDLIEIGQQRTGCGVQCDNPFQSKLNRQGGEMSISHKVSMDTR